MNADITPSNTSGRPGGSGAWSLSDQDAGEQSDSGQTLPHVNSPTKPVQAQAASLKPAPQFPGTPVGRRNSTGSFNPAEAASLAPLTPRVVQHAEQAKYADEASAKSRAMTHTHKPPSSAPPSFPSSLLHPWSPPPPPSQGPHKKEHHDMMVDRHVEELLEKRHSERANSRYHHANHSPYHHSWQGRIEGAGREACWAVLQVMSCCSPGAGPPSLSNPPQTISPCRSNACGRAEEEDFVDMNTHTMNLPGISREN